MANTFLMIMISFPMIGGIVYLFVLLCKALRKYLSNKRVNK